MNYLKMSIINKNTEAEELDELREAELYDTQGAETCDFQGEPTPTPVSDKTRLEMELASLRIDKARYECAILKEEREMMRIARERTEEQQQRKNPRLTCACEETNWWATVFCIGAFVGTAFGAYAVMRYVKNNLRL